MKAVHSPQYEVDIGLHVFPTRKFGLLRDQILTRGLVAPDDIVEPAPASWDELALVHTPGYLTKLRTGSLSIQEIARLELPWSPGVVEGFRLMTGGTIAAGRLALSEGVVLHLGGGFHHAYPDHGEGFCVFNDVAVAIRALEHQRRIARAAVVDLDVHHGNGTAAIFRNTSAVFTFSMHQEHNYPALKPPSTLDVPLPDGLGDDEYLARLARALPSVLAFGPDLVFYLAGADPYVGDQLGGLSLTFDGLRARDAMVLGACRRAGVPVAIVLAGGYARHTSDTIAIHCATVEEAVTAFGARPRSEA